MPDKELTFDNVYGEGKLEELAGLLKFKNIVPDTNNQTYSISDGQQFNGLIIFDWQKDSFSAQLSLCYSQSLKEWVFNTIAINEPGQQIMVLLCKIMPKFARELGVEKFSMLAGSEEVKTQVMKVGWQEKDGRFLKMDLAINSPQTAMEEYAAWVDSGSNPETEPSWRKEL